MPWFTFASPPSPTMHKAIGKGNQCKEVNRPSTLPTAPPIMQLEFERYYAETSSVSSLIPSATRPWTINVCFSDLKINRKGCVNRKKDTVRNQKVSRSSYLMLTSHRQMDMRISHLCPRRSGSGSAGSFFLAYRECPPNRRGKYAFHMELMDPVPTWR